MFHNLAIAQPQIKAGMASSRLRARREKLSIGELP